MFYRSGEEGWEEGGRDAEIKAQGFPLLYVMVKALWIMNSHNMHNILPV